MPKRPLPARGSAITTRVLIPRVRIESLSLSHPVCSLSDDGFSVSGSLVEPGNVELVALQLGRDVSVSLRVRAETLNEREQRFSVIDAEGRSLMRLIQAISNQEVADWLAAAPTSSSVM